MDLPAPCSFLAAIRPRMHFDFQPHVETLAQLESLQDRLLMDLEDLDRRVQSLLREAQILRASNPGAESGAVPAASPPSEISAVSPSEPKRRGKKAA